MNTLNNITKELAASSWIKLFGNKGDFRDLKDNTALVFPKSLPQSICSALIEKIDLIADNHSHPRVWRDNLASDTRILAFEQDIGDLIDYFNLKQKIRAINTYTGRKTRSWFLMANRVQAKHNNLGSGGGLHRDSPFSNQVKCIWYLSNVSPENGPFQYLPNSHNNLIKTKDKYPIGQYRFDRLNEKLTEVIADQGTLLVCDTKCIHGGKPIKEGYRYAVTLYSNPNINGARDTFKRLGINPELLIHKNIIL